MKTKPVMILAALFLFSQLFSLSLPCENVQAAEPEETTIGNLLSLQVRAKIQAQQAGGVSAAMEQSETQGVYSFLQTPDIDTEDITSQRVFIHFTGEPSPAQIAELEALGCTVNTDSWIPPAANNPTGFLTASISVESLAALADKPYISRLTTAERVLKPLNYRGTRAMFADDVWDTGYNGSGVRIAVLDSGLDMTHPDIPAPVAYKDYSSYNGTPESLDDDIANNVTGHGTHVAGSVLGRGMLSGGVYKGSAYGADLVFLKVGDDEYGSATADAIVGAMIAAVDTYDADIITMSYGGWSTYHDGTCEEAMAVDYAVSRGATVFISAGNEANDSHHVSGTVTAAGTTDYIPVSVTGAVAGLTPLFFNLVWYDGLSVHNDLTVELFDVSHNPVPTYNLTTEESYKGTEARMAYLGTAGTPYVVPAGDSTWYLKVTNNSGETQDFHIFYITYGAGSVTFPGADPHYTLSSPADADSAIAVGSYTTRTVWYDYQNNGWQYTYETINTTSVFSSRGPRVDEGAPAKITVSAPGCGIISCRDNDVYPWPGGASSRFIDNDGPNKFDEAANDGAGPADYYLMQGTSMACPLAAGAGALLLEQNPGYTPAQVKHLLEATSADKGDTGHDIHYGWGLVNALAASSASIPPLVSYNDAGYSVPGDDFTPESTVYFKAEDLHPDYGYRITYYNDTGENVTSETVMSGSDGSLTSQYTLSEEAGDQGTWYAVVSEQWFTAPGTYTPDWPYTITTDSFTLGEAQPMAVSTGNATAVTLTSATLNGSLDNLGEYASANVSFLWGTESDNLTGETSPQVIGEAGAFNDGIGSLTPGTVYYFKVKAAATGETVYGTTANFTTLLPLTVLSVTPDANAFGISVSTDIEIEFSSAINGSTVLANTIKVNGSLSGTINGTYSVNGANVTFSSNGDPKVGETVTVTLTTGIQGISSGPLTTPVTWQFMTGVPKGYGLFQDTEQLLGNSMSESVALGDTDGDGDLDAFVANTGGQTNTLWLNDGSGFYTDSGQSLGNSYSYDVSLGDLDGDGDLDAFVANYNSQGNRVWINNSGSFSNSGQSLGSSNSTGVSLGDIDNDGDLDAFVTNWGNPNKVWINNGTGTFIDSGQSLGTAWSSDVSLGDVNGNGALDAYVVNANSQPDKVWYNNGLGIFSDIGTPLSDSDNFDVALGDLDNDGDLDAFIAVGSHVSNEVWLNNGSGNFTDSGQELGASLSLSTMGVRLGDLDADGDLDAFETNHHSYENLCNKVWLNDGSGNFTDSGEQLGTSQSYCVALGDLDGDGDLDAYVANYNFQANTVWLNQPALMAETSLTEGPDNSGIVVIKVVIDRIKNPADNTTVDIPGGLGSYEAQIELPDGGIEIIDVKGVSPFEAITWTPGTGVFSAANLTSGAQASNTTVAEIAVKLTGNITTFHHLTVTFTSITAAGSPSKNIPAEGLNSMTFLRGDANGDGMIGIGDALFIAQYIIGQKDYGELCLINGACVNHDLPDGDKTGIGDALFIARYIVGQKNEYFQ